MLKMSIRSGLQVNNNRLAESIAGKFKDEKRCNKSQIKLSNEKKTEIL